MRLPALALALLAAFTGCREPERDPQAFVDAVMADAYRFKDGVLDYKVSPLPLDYFVARELLSDPGREGRGLDSLRAAAGRDYGAGSFYLLRIEVDSAEAGKEWARQQFALRMHQLQIGQEVGRNSIIAHFEDGSTAHPDVYLAQSDWISQSQLNILFGIRKGGRKRISRLEFSNSIVVTRNQEIAVGDPRPKARLKG